MNERAHCPYLGLRQNRAIRFAAPTAEHRCYVAGDAQEIPVDQRAYCLSADHRTCPLYTGDWGATTSGASVGATLALTRRGQRVRAAGRDTLFYLLVVSLVLTITAIWLGIGYLYALGSSDVPTAAASAPAVIMIPTRTPEPSAEPSVEPTTTATAIAIPPAPQGPTAVLGADRVTLDWQPGPPPLTRGYNIQRSDRERGPWIRLNGTLHTYSKYEDSGLQPNTQYFYRITTVDRNGRESQATRISVRTLASTPTPTLEPTPTPTPVPTPPGFVAPVYIPLPDPPFTPPTQVPPTPEPPTPEPPTPEPPTPEPAPQEAPTAEPPTPEPPTPEPPTPEPPTPEPPTPEPPTPEPPTPEPPTPEPPTPEPPTPEPPTPEPPTPEPPTPEPAPQP